MSDKINKIKRFFFLLFRETVASEERMRYESCNLKYTTLTDFNPALSLLTETHNQLFLFSFHFLSCFFCATWMIYFFS